MKKVITLVLTLVAFAALGFGQTPTPTPVSTTFSVNLAPVAIGSKNSITGSATGVALTVSPNFDIKNLNVVGSGLQYYSGGFNYRIPYLANLLNNVSAFDGLKFQFYVTGTVGNVSTPTGSTHLGETAGGGVNYNFNQTWALGAEIDYAKFPGYQNNGFFVEIGPKISF